MRNRKRNLFKGSPLLAVVLGLMATFCNESNRKQKTNEMMTSNKEMPTFVIEREIENVGQSTPEELKAVSQKSNSAIEAIGPDIQWQHSYVVGNKTYCVYKAKNKALIIDHARKAGAPVNAINQVEAVIGPDTAE